MHNEVRVTHLQKPDTLVCSSILHILRPVPNFSSAHCDSWLFLLSIALSILNKEPCVSISEEKLGTGRW